jgi:hypothetical protein
MYRLEINYEKEDFMKQIVVLVSIAVFIMSVFTSQPVEAKKQKKKKVYRAVLLESIERAPSVKEAKKFEKINYYEDELISIQWSPSPSALSFELKNNSSASMAIVWNESTFVDQSNESHKIMHAGIKYIDRSNSMPDTMVPKGTNTSDLLFPTDYVYYSDGWSQHDIFKSKIKGKRTVDPKTGEIIIPFTQESMKTTLVLRVSEKKYNYTFGFKTVMVEKGENPSSILPQSKLTESTTPSAPEKKQVEIKKGMTIEEVESLLGKPLKSAKVGDKIMYKYEDWKITFIDGKVAEVDF